MTNGTAIHSALEHQRFPDTGQRDRITGNGQRATGSSRIIGLVQRALHDIGLVQRALHGIPVRALRQPVVAASRSISIP